MAVSLESLQGAQSENIEIYRPSNANAVDLNNEIYNEVRDSPRTSSPYSASDVSNASMSSKLSVSNAMYYGNLTTHNICTDFTTKPLKFKQVSSLLDPGEPVPVKGSKKYKVEVMSVGNEDELKMIISRWHDDIGQRSGQGKGVHILRLNHRWRNQEIFSEELGHPQPDMTYGLAHDRLGKDYPIILSPQAESYRYLCPAKDIVLPLLFMEAKGPSSTFEEAGFQNQHNGACAIKNFVKFMRVLGKPAKTYTNKILALSIEIDKRTTQLTCHWMTINDKGDDEYWSCLLIGPIWTADLARVRALWQKVFSWIEERYADIRNDLELLEERSVAKIPKRARSPSLDSDIPDKASSKRRRVG